MLQRPGKAGMTTGKGVLPLAARNFTTPARGSRKPTYRLVPPSDGSHGAEATRLVARAGLELDPWQKDLLRDGMATLGDRWAADEVCCIVPRQNGKSLALLARALWGVTLGGEQLILWTSHEFKTSRETFLLAKQLCETDAFAKFGPVVRTGHGEERIAFDSGGRLQFVARSRTSGRGFSPDAIIVDEAFELSDLDMAALKPSVSARRAPQLWYASSAPHDTSEVLRRLCLAGRSGDGERFVYLEWSAGPDAAGDDPKAWAQANPGLGYRIPAAAITSERKVLAPVDFDRERLGRWDEQQGAQWIGEKSWTECTSIDIPGGPVGLALAGTGDAAALVGSTISDRPHVFLVGAWENVDVLELEEAIRRACTDREVLRIAGDPARWSRTIQVLEGEGYPMVEFPLTAARMVPASERFREAVLNHQLTHDDEPELERDVLNTLVKVDDRGTRIVKDRPAAVAAVVAHDLAADLAANAFHVW